MIHETPIMKLCDQVRHAFCGMELCLRRTTNAVMNDNELGAISELMGLSEHCKSALMAINDFRMEIEKKVPLR